ETARFGVAYTAGTGDRLAGWEVTRTNTWTFQVSGFSSEDPATNDATGCVTQTVYRGPSCREERTLTWDAQYRLTAAATNGAPAESYGYDPLGRRMWTEAGGVTNLHLYDGAHLLADLDATGGVVRSYVYGPEIDELVAMTIHTGDVPRTFYALRDHQNTVWAWVDESGNVAESYDYDAWGRVLGIYDGEGASMAQSAIGNRFLFQGREYSFATGLYHFRARWYDPVTGRWLSNDPIGIEGGLNQYVFCGNDPVNYSDPDGQNPIVVAAVLLLLAGAEDAVAPENEEQACNPAYAGGQGMATMFMSGAIMFGTGVAINGVTKVVGNMAAKRPVWKPGTHKSLQKLENQMQQRGWTSQQIDEAMSGGKQFTAPNKVNSGNTATRYVHPETGRSVVVDDVTSEVLHCYRPN
ncbi:MAG: hypothetical protein FJ222_09665, partial [Lentisphaerae bacterium]|nr:hypothetical protein [Lentisphaerota bacterium]